jgi:hypothetical protein
LEHAEGAACPQLVREVCFLNRQPIVVAESGPAGSRPVAPAYLVKQIHGPNDEEVQLSALGQMLMFLIRNADADISFEPIGFEGVVAARIYGEIYRGSRL